MSIREKLAEIYKDGVVELDVFGHRKALPSEIHKAVNGKLQQSKLLHFSEQSGKSKKKKKKKKQRR